jgi:thioredoxin-related protein
MKLLARIGLMAWLGLAAFAAPAGEGLTTVTIDGQTYSHISEVRVSSGGRVTILYGLGGRSVRPDQLPAEFLASWGITQKNLERTADKPAGSTTTWLANQNLQLLDQAVADGLIREVDGIVCDLRQPPADWERFDRAKVWATTQKGALVDRTPDGSARDFVLVFNLPFSEGSGRVTFIARRAGSMSYPAPSGAQTILAYDAGRICTRAEVPEAMVKGGAAQVELPGRASQAKAQGQARLDAAPQLLAKLDAVQMQLQTQSEASGPWLTSLTEAQALAAQKNKLILLDFTGSDWCVWCKKLDAEIFSTRQFTDYASKYLVLVRADFPQNKPQPADLRAANQTLKTQFGISAFPTLVAMKPDGTVVWKQAGYVPGGPLVLIAQLDGAMTK